MAQGGVVRVLVSRDCLETWDAIGGAPIEPVISKGGIKLAIMSDSGHAFQIESIVRCSRVLVMSKASTLASWTHIVRCDAFAYRCVEQQQVPTPSASSKVAFITVQRKVRVEAESVRGREEQGNPPCLWNTIETDSRFRGEKSGVAEI